MHYEFRSHVLNAWIKRWCSGKLTKNIWSQCIMKKPQKNVITKWVKNTCWIVTFCKGVRQRWQNSQENNRVIYSDKKISSFIKHVISLEVFFSLRTGLVQIFAHFPWLYMTFLMEKGYSFSGFDAELYIIFQTTILVTKTYH